MYMAKAQRRYCHADTIVGVTCAILVLLFAFQRFGTSKVGFTFAPIVLLWFTANVMVNLYNIIVYYPGACLPGLWELQGATLRLINPAASHAKCCLCLCEACRWGRCL